ncbi:MAG: hypothetical protein KDJ65_28935 [Anaerolineae bacterium]|nr:hypothetical protein [Anaerolineae bacterium]
MNTKPSTSLPLRRVAHVWWPLAASWVVMTIELPLISAIIARLAHPEINLAAWGVVFGLATIVQAPSTMLLAASTALSKDWLSYLKLRRIMFGILLVLTLIHALIAFTPLCYVVLRNILGVPAEIIEPARLGLMIMTPWTFGTGYRRFQQGVLIQFDHARAVIWGSILRLISDNVVLLLGLWLGTFAGIVVGPTAIIAGVLTEAVYAHWCVQPILRDEVRSAPKVEPVLTMSDFSRFYIPLAVMVLLTLVMQPLVSAALSRMPRPLESLAIWPVVYGFLIIWQSVGISYNEAVIALLDRPGAVDVLRRVSWWAATLMSLLLAIVLATPLAGLWFTYVAALPPALVDLARQSAWMGLLLPALRLMLSWYQGGITYSRQTRAITESVIIFLVICATTLGAGVVWQTVTGVYVGIAAIGLAYLAQTLWLRYRSQPAFQAVQRRDLSRAVAAGAVD